MTKRVFLSVDFDYFCREEDEWDWGHSENSDMFNEIYDSCNWIYTSVFSLS